MFVPMPPDEIAVGLDLCAALLLEKRGRKCAYCGRRDVPLQVEHIPPRSRGGLHRVFGFQTGDMVTANVPAGKHAGSYRGRVAVRSSGKFNIKADGNIVQGTNYRYCRLDFRSDGYSYHRKEVRLPPPACKQVVSAANFL